MKKEGCAVVDIDLLLNELHTKRKWLDTVIAGLESAIQSSDNRLIESLGAAYSNGHSGGRRSTCAPGNRRNYRV